MPSQASSRCSRHLVKLSLQSSSQRRDVSRNGELHQTAVQSDANVRKYEHGRSCTKLPESESVELL
jgi:hypothetical protein